MLAHGTLAHQVYLYQNRIRQSFVSNFIEIERYVGKKQFGFEWFETSWFPFYYGAI